MSEYKLKTGRYRGQMLKDIPASYLLYCFENNWLEDVAHKYVSNNEQELRNKAKKEKL